MMKSRKFWIISLLLAMCCMLFVACGTQQNNNPGGGSGGGSDGPAAVTAIRIVNREELTTGWTLGSAARTVHVAYTPDTYTETNLNFTVKSSDTQVISVTGKRIRAVGIGTATVTVTAVNVSDSITITVAAGEPELLATETVTAKDSTAYPVSNYVVATASDGLDITNHVEVTCNQNGFVYDSDNRTMTFNQAGTYTVTYTVADPRDASKSAVKTATFNVLYNPIEDSVSNAIFNISGDTSSSVVTTQTSGYIYAAFRTTASKIYYAEATFNISNPTQSNCVGLGHITSGNVNRQVSTHVDRGSITGARNFKMMDLDLTKTPVPNFQEDHNREYNVDGKKMTLWNYRLSEYRGINDPDASTAKYAVARIGNMFYVFLNDQYIASSEFTDYATVDTIPGITGLGLASTVQISGITTLSGNEAQTKVEGLLEHDFIKAYAPESWAAGSKNNFSTAVQNVGKDENGYKFDFTRSDIVCNDGMVTPYIYFEGDFSVEWIYKATEVGSGDAKRAYLELRDWRYGKPILHLGERHSDRLFLMDRQPETPDAQVPELKWRQPAFGDFDFTQGTRYKLTRQLTDTAAIYTLSVTSVANPNQKYERTINYSNDASGNPISGWNGPVIFHWKNWDIAGSYTGIKISNFA